MNYILDTHTFLWFINGDPKLSSRSKETIENNHNVIMLSAAVVWEISIKSKIGKIRLNKTLDTLISDCIQQYNLTPLAITIPHTIKVSDLQEIHKDPFDRILIAQAILENAAIITSDNLIKKYGANVIW